MSNGHCAHLSMAEVENRVLGDALEARPVERNSRKLIRMLEQDGWVLDRVNGDHHTFKHPEREKIITVTHPRKDLPIGLVRRIYKLAGWRT
jgi:predicted RNA binding protein YcfA (HicA-like mRNA interferase family)